MEPNKRGHWFAKHAQEASKHDKAYTDLVIAYVKSVETTLKHKRRLKICFFAIIMIILLAVIGAFGYSLFFVKNFILKNGIENDISVEDIISLLTLVLPAALSLVVAFFKLPEIIAKYLFNTQEDAYMTNIIKNLQDYDKSIIEIEHINGLLEEYKVDSFEINDDNIPNGPPPPSDSSQGGNSRKTV